jgi:mRNA deadenylase 3'-5' endonuclease subunit Ccr4
LALGIPAGGGHPAPHPVARHPLSLRSAYCAVAGREPPYTTCHGRYIGTVDYVWYTAEPVGEGGATLRALGVLQPPRLAGIHSGLPSAEWPSDHVALVADFEVASAQQPQRR